MNLEIYRCDKSNISGEAPKVRLTSRKDEILCTDYDPRDGNADTNINIEMGIQKILQSDKKTVIGYTTCVNNVCVFYRMFCAGSETKIEL
ncbi:hypothetical protein A3A76_02960 [Candidatus Woesebacteria bacterium RIFCSPLOWO2_01_FULL_39_23]|uniref:Uncharacterized protein n=1 Tax=Candidatus Woesebacteria bacterium RIFCSPHIGHO2_01_FULL_40_22 TaxID=1802499 RepID=A0A1F7YKL8_9BACT|nr:MAG: hypothetical protein A2141_01060 [Candidatus Woesebacteria bacterium RBG_16_40_11]OGM27429.1 MAG: hypothetical protein A2628_01365 [Candidatus Woesebacteria bacterium RIFCSPHIGHO2_01_FULL_40_22]OGM36191.1 MAG: hypothetical protein A3E41_01650 [Candidatus Woesebacteria bacterium RIFCSPHIGHO2_12_FULL_38_9]OGM62601.1 MAG: hypothetical protein A3A76_02960 [Candidatus Woesebacteria bacterium RIFCSPLOWO2_01_FULL_39_23]